jgi:hypothetical protein
MFVTSVAPARLPLGDQIAVDRTCGVEEATSS